jgi:hypothetical protein
MSVETSENTLERHLSEARTYDVMGLKDEALSAYEAALALLTPSDPRRQVIAERFQELRKDMGFYSDSEAGDEIADSELSSMAVAFEGQQDVSPILAAARALRAKNHWGQAAEEYEKLLDMGYPASIVMPEFIACLIKEHPDRIILDTLHRISENPTYSKDKRTSLLCLIGMELGNHGMFRDALSFVFSAYQEDPKETQYQRHLIRLTSNVAAATRYAHLISLGMVSPAQIQKAALLAAKEHKSIEWTLIHALKVSKHLLLSALAQLNVCPFIPDISTSKTGVPLANRIKKEDLLIEAWIPFVSHDGIVDVWMEDPGDARRMGWVRSHLDVDVFQYRVALREDIQQLVESLYLSPDQKASIPDVAKSEETPTELPDTTQVKVFDDERRHVREQVIGQELLTAQFYLKDKEGIEKEYILKVDNHTRHGLGLLVSGPDLELLSRLKVGDTIREVNFYAGWAMIRVDAVIKHQTPVAKDGESEAYIFGVASEDLI